MTYYSDYPDEYWTDRDYQDEYYDEYWPDESTTIYLYRRNENGRIRAELESNL